MRFITIGNDYVNVDSIESIGCRKSQQRLTRETVVRTKSGKEYTVSDSNDLSKAYLEKILDSSGGFKER